MLAAASEDDFKAAYAAAEAANKQAGLLRDQWTATATALADAKKAADAGNFDQAMAVIEGSRSAGQGFDFPGHQRKRRLEGSGNTLSWSETARRHRMTIRRRDFLKLTGAAALLPGLSRAARGADSTGVYDLDRFGNARILHMTDTHAQLQPIYFREPSVNLGIGAMQGKPPHLVGQRLSQSIWHQA